MDKKIHTYLFFDDKGELGTIQGYSVNNAFLKLFGMPYNFENSNKIFYTILRK